MKTLKKPKSFWAFFIFLFFALSFQASHADFYGEHVKPVQTRAFDSSSRRLLTAGVGSLWLAQSMDSPMRDQWKNHQTMSEETAEYGDRFDQYGIGPLIALGQLYWDHENGVSHARALIYSGVTTQVLKHSLQRRRPDGSDLRSMPSGHTSSAFATATALTYSYGWKAGIVMYPLATFVGLSRLADDRHWFSDTVAGAFIGIWLGRASSYRTSEEEKNLVQFQVLPLLQSRFQGLTVQMEF